MNIKEEIIDELKKFIEINNIEPTSLVLPSSKAIDLLKLPEGELPTGYKSLLHSNICSIEGKKLFRMTVRISSGNGPISFE